MERDVHRPGLRSAQAVGGADLPDARLGDGGDASAAQSGTTGDSEHLQHGRDAVAGEILRHAVGMPLADYLYERIWNRVGMEADATWWLDSPNGVEIGGSGFSATLRDYGRLGLFVLAGGVARGDSILPPGWMAEASSGKTLRGSRALDYGYLWWPATTARGRRDRAFSGEGIHGQTLYINPTERVVIVVWSAQVRPTGGAPIDNDAFLQAVVEALR